MSLSKILLFGALISVVVFSPFLVFAGNPETVTLGENIVRVVDTDQSPPQLNPGRTNSSNSSTAVSRGMPGGGPTRHSNYPLEVGPYRGGSTDADRFLHQKKPVHRETPLCQGSGGIRCFA